MTKRKKLSSALIHATYLRQKARRKVRRAALIEALGGKCTECGRPGFKFKPAKDGYGISIMGITSRIALYERLHAAGQLRLLCGHCCSMTGAHYGGRKPKTLNL